MSVPKIIQDIRDLKSQIIPLDRGGTGATTADEARTNLDAQQRTKSLPTEATLADSDTIPFYSDADRRTTWNNVKSTLKTHFDTIYSDILKVTSVANYNILTATKETVSTQDAAATPIPTGGWTPVSGRSGVEYTSGNYRIVGSSYSGSDFVTYAVDANISSRWVSSSTEPTPWYKVVLPIANLVNKVKVSYNASKIAQSSSDTGLRQFKIQGSNDDSTWVDLYSEGYDGATNPFPTPTTGTTTLRELTLVNPNYYKYYRLYFVQSNTGSGIVNEFQLSNYTIPTYTIKYKVEGIPTTFVNNQRLLIQTPATDTSGVTSNTVNDIALNAILKPSTKYELIYNNDDDDGKFYAKEVL